MRVAYIQIHTIIVQPGRPEPIPAGTYEATLIAAATKDSKAGNRYILLTWEVAFGPHSGRHVMDNAMRSHPNPAVVGIGDRKLRAIMSILGQAADTAEWVGKRLRIEVIVKPDDRGEPRNEIGAYNPLRAKAPLSAPPAPPSAPPPEKSPPPQPPRIPGQKPWERSADQ
jgi:hypothetical protein